MTDEEKELLEYDILHFFEYLYEIPKDPMLDNEVYYPAYYSDKRYNLIWGGRGSGKSYDVEGKLPVVLISCLPFCRILMIREIFASIMGSQFQEVKDYIEAWELTDEFHITTRPPRITHKKTGNFIAFAGMDKPDSIKSVKDVTHVIFGEACQLKSMEGFDTVDKSIRTPRIDMTKIYMVFNPDNVTHFINKLFFDGELEDQYRAYRDNMLSINTTHWDNKFVPYGFRELIEKDKIANPDRYKVDGLGLWGELKSLNAYYPNFKTDKHVQRNLKSDWYDPNISLHLAFDFNVYPYITLEVIQVHEIDGKLAICHIDEICLNEKQHGAEKSGSIKETMKEFFNRYERHRGKVYVYGDKSGHNRKTNAVSDYSTIFNMLKPTPTSLFVGGRDPFPEYRAHNCTFEVVDRTNKSKNPSHQGRKLFWRRLHSGTLGVLPLSRKLATKNAVGRERGLSANHAGKQIIQLIDEKCQFLINDYINTEEDELKGNKDERNKNLTHCSDAVDYFATTYFNAEFGMIEAELKR